MKKEEIKNRQKFIPNSTILFIKFWAKQEEFNNKEKTIYLEVFVVYRSFGDDYLEVYCRRAWRKILLESIHHVEVIKSEDLVTGLNHIECSGLPYARCEKGSYGVIYPIAK